MSIPLRNIDLQTTSPDVALALDTVGITGIIRGIVLDGTPTTAQIDVSCALDPAARGAHMSRFHEAIDQALRLVGDDGHDVRSLELLAGVIATRAAELQGVPRASAQVSATLAQRRVTPDTGRVSVDPFDAWARVDVERRDAGGAITNISLGVRVVGMTACPCAQLLVRDAAVERMEAAGLDASVIDAALTHVPVATHNQRSTASLELTCTSDAAISSIAPLHVLADLVRGSMSAGVHELLKRGDERAVVEAAHADARFVEDCVRALLHDAAGHEALAELAPTTKVAVEQVNHESIHAHDVRAARTTTLAALRRDLGLDAELAHA